MLQQAALLVTAFAVVQAFNLDRYEGVESAAGRRWSRIVSGWDAQPGQHPHQAVIRMVNEDGRVGTCGACIVHTEWLLTAAHCTAGQVTFVVRAGLIDISKPEMLLEATRHYLYPSYDASRPASVQLNDISMIKLEQPLKYSHNLRAIRIQPAADAYRSYAGETLIASGFGRNWTDGIRPSRLQWVYLRGIPNEDCISTFSKSYISENNICALYYNETSQSICQGDNGGPLVHMSSDQEPILIGISSFIADTQRRCHAGYPSVFTRTGPFHSWFKEVSGIDFDNLHGEKKNESTTLHSTTDPPTSYPTSESYPTTKSYSTTSPTKIPTTTISIADTNSTVTSPTTSSTSTSVTSASVTSTSVSSTSVSSTSVTPTSSVSSSTVQRNSDVKNSEVQKAMEVDIRVNVKLNKDEKKELGSESKA